MYNYGWPSAPERNLGEGPIGCEYYSKFLAEKVTQSSMCYIKFHVELTLWEVSLVFLGETSKDTNLRVLVRGSTVEAVLEQCHRAYPDGRIDCIFRSAIEEICPRIQVLEKRTVGEESNG